MKSLKFYNSEGMSHAKIVDLITHNKSLSNESVIARVFFEGDEFIDISHTPGLTSKEYEIDLEQIEALTQKRKEKITKS